jgi:hypothetical protein
MDFDKRIFKLACRDYILETVNSSKHLREQLSLLQHAKMYEWAKKLTYEQMISVIFEQEGKPPVDARKIRDYESRWSKMAKYGLIAYFASHFLPITMPMALFLTYMFRRFSDPCRKRCKAGFDKKCMAECKIESTKKVIAEIMKARGQCNGKEVANPEKCVKRFDKEIRKWQGRLAKAQKQLAKTLGR